MHLVIDIGNSLTKALFFDDEGQAGTLLTGPSDGKYIQELLDTSDATSVAVASVVNLDEEVLSMIKEKRVLMVNARTPIPISNNYASQETLGIDRICAAVGANALFPSNTVLAIDMGTCITYELVTADGTYLGGSISPGLRMRFRALSEFTSKLPQLEPESASPLVGFDTTTSIRSGVQHGILLEVEGIINSYLQQYPDLKIVGTGGDFPFFASAFKRPIFADPILVLRGVHEILLHSN